MDFRSLPKIELHAHLTGSISRETLHEIWQQKKERNETTLEDPLIVMPLNKRDYDLETFFPLFTTYIYALITTLPTIHHTTHSILSSFQSDGVIYLELRTTPRAIPSSNISREEYIQTILHTITTINSTSPTMATRLILSIDRRHSLETALETVYLAQKYKSLTGIVVGIDLCGDPSQGDISLFAPAFLEAKKHGLKITIHFGEIEVTPTSNELEVLLSYGPERIGHVIYMPDDVKGEIVRRKLGLELCVSCNVHAKMIEGSYRDHHFGEWWKTGCPIALGTDDVGVFRSSLSNEYALVAEHFNLNRKQICDLARSPIDIIFGDEVEKERLRGLMWKEYKMLG